MLLWTLGYMSHFKSVALVFFRYVPRRGITGSYASLVAKMVKNLPAMQETWVWSLGWEDPLEEGMSTHSSILASRIPMDREPAGYSPWDRRVGHYWAPKHRIAHLFLVFWETSVLFSTVAAPSYIPTNNVWGFPFLHILSNIYYLVFFFMIAIVIGVRWYLILVWICVYLYLVMLSIFSCVCWPSAFLLPILFIFFTPFFPFFSFYFY